MVGALNSDPIVCLVSTYREGNLARGAIRSALKATQNIIVFEGLTETEHINGDPTIFGNYKKYLKSTANWKSESDKRTAMLKYAKRHYGSNFWCLLVDADEILVWGEYLQDWLHVLSPGPGSDENIVPIKVTEGTIRTTEIELEGEQKVEIPMGVWTDIGPSHLYHASIIDHYVVGAWQFATPDGRVGVLDRKPAMRPPMMGEPHIHHRSYLRRGDRKEFRASGHEEQRWLNERGITKSY